MTHKMTNKEIHEAYKKEGGPELERNHSDDYLTNEEQWQIVIEGMGVIVCLIAIVMALQAHPELWDALKQLLGG